MPTNLLPRRLRALLAAVPLSLSLAACGGGDAAPGDSAAEDADAQGIASVTEAEQQAFRAPADSVLTAEQVDRYLKTTLVQFDLVRKQADSMRVKAKAMEERSKDGGFIAGLRNVADAGSLALGWADMVGGSYVRSARSLGYNPAEMEWVRERMTEVSGYLVTQPMMEQAEQGAGQLQQQVAEMRRQLEAGQLPGFTKEQLDSLAAQAEQGANEAKAAQSASRAVLANAEVLRKARPAVSDTAWQMVGMTGSTGLVALAGLVNPDDQEAQKGLNELRALYTSVLANKPYQPSQNAGASPTN